MKETMKDIILNASADMTESCHKTDFIVSRGERCLPDRSCIIRILKDLKSDKKHYKKELKEAKRRLESELSSRYGRTIHVEVLADLFDVTDEEWRNAIEGRLGRIKFGLVVEPRYALDAAKIFRRMKKEEYETVDLINTAAILRDKSEAVFFQIYRTDFEFSRRSREAWFPVGSKVTCLIFFINSFWFLFATAEVPCIRWQRIAEPCF